MRSHAKALARRFVQHFFDPGALDELVSAGFVQHDPLAGETDLDATRRHVALVRGAFPDVRVQPQEVLAEGDRAFVRWVARGTHEGPFLGIDATGRSVRLEGMSLVHVRDGHVVEAWASWDVLRLLQSIEVMPELEEAPDEAPSSRPALTLPGASPP